MSELVELGKLTRFDFLGRTYVSMREVGERRDQDLKAGRPARNFTQRLVAGIKAGFKADAGQLRQGGYTEFAAKQKTKKLAKRKK